VSFFHPIITVMLPCCSSPYVAAAFVLFAVSFKPLVVPFLADLSFAPLDTRIVTLPILTPDELRHVYSGKRVLVIGGTRGVGLGTALAAAGAGASVTIVGRSEKGGKRALERLREVAPEPGGSLELLQEMLGLSKKRKPW
jgi:hypothetical protein